MKIWNKPSESAALLRLEILPEWMRRIAVDIDFRIQVEGGAVLTAGEFLDFLIRSRFLQERGVVKDTSFFNFKHYILLETQVDFNITA